MRLFVAYIKFYESLLNEGGKALLLQYVFNTRLSGEAACAFLTEPTSLSELYSTLSDRFKVHETAAGLNHKLSKVYQGNRYVEKYANEIKSAQLHSQEP